MESDAKLLSRQIFPAQSTHIMERKNIYKQALKVFYSLLLPHGIRLFPFLIWHKECIVSRAITSSLDYTGKHMAQGRIYRLQKREKWESSSDPSHLTRVCSGDEYSRMLTLNRQIFQML